MSDRLYEVVFPNGEKACVYARGLAFAYGPAEFDRRWPDGKHGHMNGIDAVTELSMEFRDELGTGRQIEEARRLELEKLAIWLMGPDEHLGFGDLAQMFEDKELGQKRVEIARGFLARQTQEDWERAKLLPVGELCEPCLQALILRGLRVFAMTQVDPGLSHAEANLKAPPYRETLCARCADIVLKKKEPGAEDGDGSEEEDGGPRRPPPGQVP